MTEIILPPENVFVVRPSGNAVAEIASIEQQLATLKSELAATSTAEPAPAPAVPLTPVGEAIKNLEKAMERMAAGSSQADYFVLAALDILKGLV
jgi:hypothetical protein